MGLRKILEILKYFRKDLTYSQNIVFRNGCVRQYASVQTKIEKKMCASIYSWSKTQATKMFLRSDLELSRNSKLVPEATVESVRHYCSRGDNKFICSPSRHHYHEEVEAAVNNQILAEFNAGFAYLSMACYFARSDVALYGTSNFFMRMYRDEIDHALAFIDHQNLRGGQVKLCAITTMECSDWCSIHKALEVSLEMEKLILDKLTDLAKLAEKHKDINTHDVVSSVYIKDGISSVKHLGGLLARITKLGMCSMSEYFFDKELSTSTTNGSTY